MPQPKQHLELQLKHTAEYRVACVEVMCGYAIGQVKIVYSDGSFWACGGDSGADCRKLILTPNECLIKVQQELFVNRSSCGAGFKFTTNKGRFFEFSSCLSSRRKSELTEVTAEPGHEIVGLIIRGGVFCGTCQQPAAPPTLETQAVQATKQWFAVATVSGEHLCKDAVQVQHFFDKSEAQAAWRDCKASHVVNGALLLDCFELKGLAKQGDVNTVAVCSTAAESLGLLTPLQANDVPVLDRLWKLATLLGDRQDLLAFSLTLVFLLSANYFALEATMLRGLVLAVVTESDVAKVQAMISGNSFSALALSVLGGSDLAEFKWCAIAAFVVVEVANALLYVTNVFIHCTHFHRKARDVCEGIFRKVLGLDQAYFDTHSKSEVRNGMRAHSLCSIISWRVPYFITQLLRLGLTSIFMLRMSTHLSVLAVTGFMLLKFGLFDPVNKRRRMLGRLERKLDIYSDQLRDDAIVHLDSVKLFAKEDWHLRQYSASFERKNTVLHETFVLRCFEEFTQTLAQALIFAAVTWSSVQIYHQQIASSDNNVSSDLNAATVATFYMLFDTFRHNFNASKHEWDEITREFADIDRFLNLMEAESSLEQRDGPKTRLAPEEVKGEIEFKDVDFEYPSRPGEKVLSNLNLKIKANQVTAVVGDSGSGKSTLIKLLLRTYDPLAGSVTLDGVDLRDLDLDDLKTHVGVVNQAPQLFHTSLAENIGYGAKGNPSPAEVYPQVVAAAKLSKCFDFISAFRGGFDTFAGSSGSQLSGGQRQRVAIARAAVRDPKILILDEATSALDAENEHQVQAAMDNLMKGRTTIVVAHRLSTIKNAAEIICLAKGGTVAERGTHDELMERDGPYRKLVELQLMPKEDMVLLKATSTEIAHAIEEDNKAVPATMITLAKAA